MNHIDAVLLPERHDRWSYAPSGSYLLRFTLESQMPVTMTTASLLPFLPKKRTRVLSFVHHCKCRCHCLRAKGED